MTALASLSDARGDVRQHFDFAELSSLRREMLLRIAFQNLLLVMMGPMLIGSVIAEIALPRSSGLVMLGFLVATGAMSLIWCHHGVRQAQLKTYLLLLEARLSPAGGWENWLPRNPVGGMLGSRWFISTKGVFLGSQAAAIAAATVSGAGNPWMWGPIACLLFLGTGFFLLINPKEGLEVPAP